MLEGSSQSLSRHFREELCRSQHVRAHILRDGRGRGGAAAEYGGGGLRTVWRAAGSPAPTRAPSPAAAPSSSPSWASSGILHYACMLLM